LESLNSAVDVTEDDAQREGQVELFERFVLDEENDEDHREHEEGQRGESHREHIQETREEDHESLHDEDEDLKVLSAFFVSFNQQRFLLCFQIHSETDGDCNSEDYIESKGPELLNT
jgi:hypothetical protein